MKYIAEFTVTSQLRFPIDMLRYDRCTPATSEDAAKITASVAYQNIPERQEIRLRAWCSTKAWRPTEARWQSFGWKVEGRVEVRHQL